jgi:DNA helicase HerA-like ATPase
MAKSIHKLPNPPKQPTIKHECVLGTTGSGKSYYIKTKILPKYFDKKDVLKIIIDPEDEYSYLKIPTISLKSLNPKKIAELLKKYRAVRITIPTPKNRDEFKENLEILGNFYLFILENWKKLYKYCRARGLVMVIDECQDCGADSRYLSYPLIGLLKKGRKRNIKCILATQRVSYFSTDIRSQCRIKILFKVVEPIDIKRYEEISKEATELLLNSKKPYPYIIIEDGKIIEKDV